MLLIFFLFAKCFTAMIFLMLICINVDYFDGNHCRFLGMAPGKRSCVGSSRSLNNVQNSQSLEQRDSSTNEVNGAPDQVADSVHSQQESGNLLL